MWRAPRITCPANSLSKHTEDITTYTHTDAASNGTVGPITLQPNS